MTFEPRSGDIPWLVSQIQSLFPFGGLMSPHRIASYFSRFISRSFAIQALPQVGGTHRPRLRAGHPSVAGSLRASHRHHREARPASSARHRPARRSLRRDERRAAGIRRRLPRVLLRADLRSAAGAGNRCLQPGHAAHAAAGDGERDGAQRLQEGPHRQRTRRQRKPAAAVRAGATGHARATMWSMSSGCRAKMFPDARRSRLRRTTCTPANPRPRT